MCSPVKAMGTTTTDRWPSLATASSACAVEDRLRPVLAQEPVAADAGDEPARDGAVVEQRDVTPARGQELRGREPRDAAAKDEDAHARAP